MKYCRAVVAILLLVAPIASADSLNVVAGDAAWHAFERPSTIGGAAFWNNSSFDGLNHDCNIGYWLSGLGGCTALDGRFRDASPNLTPEYLGDSTTRFGIVQDGTTESVTVTTKVQVTSWYPGNEFGWYPLADPANRNPLFGRFAPPFGTATFIPSGDYGFYLVSRHGTYLSAGSPETPSHFAVFRLEGAGHYLIGAEDMWFGSDWDYNDMAIGVQFNPVPEPASVFLVGTGLLGLLSRIRRTRSRRLVEGIDSVS